MEHLDAGFDGIVARQLHRLAAAPDVTAVLVGPIEARSAVAAQIAGYRKLHRHDWTTVVSRYIGETEKNLGRVFDAAEADGAILFFDEADALFGRRTGIGDAHDRYADAATGALLRRLDDVAGPVILGSNRRVNLDQAFLRRLTTVVRVD